MSYQLLHGKLKSTIIQLILEPMKEHARNIPSCETNLCIVKINEQDWIEYESAKHVGLCWQ